MAIQKSKNNNALALHCLTYSACFLPWGLTFALITFFTHFWVDYYTSRCTSKLWFIDLEPMVVPALPGTWFDYYAHITPWKRHWFFVMIGLDQLLHFAILALTYKFLFGG